MILYYLLIREGNEFDLKNYYCVVHDDYNYKLMRNLGVYEDYIKQISYKYFLKEGAYIIVIQKRENNDNEFYPHNR